MNKRGIVPAELIYAIIGLLVVGIVAYTAFEPVKEASDELFREADKAINYKKEFVPFSPELTDEDQQALTSMTALINAINAIAKDEDIDLYSNNKIKSNQINFDHYEVSFSSVIEIESNSLLAKAYNDFFSSSYYREWNFKRKFYPFENNQEINSKKEQRMFADYHIGSCDNTNAGKWVSCTTPVAGTKQIDPNGNCFCQAADNPNDILDDLNNLNIDPEKLLEAKKANLAPIRDLTRSNAGKDDSIYNIQLTTYDKEGNILCTATTHKEKMTDTTQHDFLAAGTLSAASCPGNDQFQKGDGCDRDGDGIQGNYGKKYHGMDWRTVIESTNNAKEANSKKSKVSNEEIKQYFDQDQKIKATAANGEGCLDSPTWLECPGIRIYYCAKTGHQSYSNKKDSNYYFHFERKKNPEGKIQREVHSNSGIQFLRIIDPKFDKKQSHQFREGSNTISIFNHDTGISSSLVAGSWNYAKEYDADLILDTALSAVTISKIGPETTSSSNMKKMQDPRAYCNGGKQINDGPIVKCDSSTQTCGVCDFNLPQEVRQGQTALEWFAGYGDPKYVVYYEAFPYGEDEAWQIDVTQASLSSIIAWNAAVRLAIPIGGKLVQKGTKVTGFLAKKLGAIVGASTISRLVKAGVKVILWPAKVTVQGIKFLADKVSHSITSGFDNVARKIISPEMYLRIFTNADNIIKYADANDLKKVGKTVEQVAEALVKDDKAFLEATEAALKNEQILSRAQIFSRSIPSSLATKGPKYALALAAGYAIAREDSMNQKFYPIGINNIGTKKPYDLVFTTGDQLPTMEKDASKYYIQLIKDKYKGGFFRDKLENQPSNRFFLASPCSADLVIMKDNCKCWAVDEGTDVEIPTSEEFGTIPVLKAFVNEESTEPAIRYKDAVKVCRDRDAGLTSTTLKDPVYQGECISVNPIIKDNTFCYSGSHTFAEIAKVGVFAGTVAASVAVESAFTAGKLVTLKTVVGPIALTAIQIGVDSGIDFIGASIEGMISEQTKWPNH